MKANEVYTSNLNKLSRGIQDMIVFLFLYHGVYLLTYLLTPSRGVFLEKVTGSQLVRKFCAFHGTQRFITTFTRAHQLSLS